MLDIDHEILLMKRGPGINPADRAGDAPSALRLVHEIAGPTPCSGPPEMQPEKIPAS